MRRVSPLLVELAALLEAVTVVAVAVTSADPPAPPPSPPRLPMLPTVVQVAARSGPRPRSAQYSRPYLAVLPD